MKKNTKSKRNLKFILSGLVVLSVFLFSPALWAGEDVVHWWVGDAESKALKVIVDEFERSGNKWVDTPHNDSEAAHASVKSNMVVVLYPVGCPDPAA